LFLKASQESCGFLRGKFCAVLWGEEDAVILALHVSHVSLLIVGILLSGAASNVDCCWQ
jgi:hypothetical protein